MRQALLLIALSGLVAATSSFANPVSGNGGAVPANSSGALVAGPQTSGIQPLDAVRRQRAIDALMRESRQLQRADGGTLTPAHHIWLETRLNAISAGHY